jgi:hypothetical protein
VCLLLPTVGFGRGIYAPLLPPQRLLELDKKTTIVESHRAYKSKDLWGSTHPKALIFEESKEEALI